MPTERLEDCEGLVVLCTCPDVMVAEKLAQTIVEQHLAACVNLLPSVTSIYHWQGAIERATECLLLIKTERAVYPALESALAELHPYQVPEIVALPIVQGLPPYLRWMAESVGPASANVP